MPRDASGTYTRTNGNFSGATTWQQQAASASKVIASDQHDTHDQDQANALTDSLDRTGKGGMQATLDMNNNKVLNVADGTMSKDAVNFGQLSGYAGLATINRFTQQQQWNVGTEIASAATLNIPDDGNAFKVTGVTTITAFSTKPVGTWIWLEFDDALTLTHGPNLLLNNNGDDIAVEFGDRAICIQGTATAWTVWIMRASGQAVRGANVVVGRAYAEKTSLQTITNIIPMDDTIPQITEGSEVFSQAYQAASATNRLRFTINIAMDHETSQRSTVALFKASGPGAVAAVPQSVETTARPETSTIVFEVDAGDTTNNTWSVRVGPFSSGSIFINGIGPGTRLYGGVCISSMVIEEVTP